MCDASNRLFRNTSHDRLGGFRAVSRVMSYGTFQILSENTCSEYRIPPQNTPEEADQKHIIQTTWKLNTITKTLR